MLIFLYTLLECFAYNFNIFTATWHRLGFDILICRTVCEVLFFFLSFCSQNTIMEASIQLPSSLFSPKQKREARATDDSLYKLQLIAFRNGKLFPATGNSTKLADDGKRRTVVTPVILTKIGLCGRWSPAVAGHHGFYWLLFLRKAYFCSLLF